MWNFQDDFQARHPGQSVAVSASSYQQVLRSGANADAVWYRLSVFRVVQLITKTGAAQLPWLPDSKPSEAVFKALAVVPMQFLAVGKPASGFPFDVDEFSKLVDEQSQSGAPENSQL